MEFRYPVVLSLTGRKCLLIGEGPEAEQKAAALKEAGAEVLRRQSWCESDFDGCFLVMIAARDPETRRSACEQARRRGVLCNSVDDPAHCDFILPAIHRQGDLTVAISTNGKSPMLAVQLRDRIAASIGPEYGRLAGLLGELRTEVAARIPDFERRRSLWRRLADSGALELLRGGEEGRARERLREVLEEQTL